MNSIVPIFPCTSVDETIEFYEQLGFTVTYRQKSPNPYTVVRKDWIELHFYGLKTHVPGKSYHTCYITTDETDELYEAFTAALRKANGKLPSRGLPRISDIRDKSYGVREFMFHDLAGNCIRIGRKLHTTETAPLDKDITSASDKLSQLLDFCYKKEDEADEIEVLSPLLDKAIEKYKDYPCHNLFKVMLHRADIAITQGNSSLAATLLEQVRTHPHISEQPGKFRMEQQRATDLLHKLSSILPRVNQGAKPTQSPVKSALLSKTV
ncbi:MAG TPA: VOC family protein [Chitinophaga sp.]|uniref:bleomycin resistance protein n=1 Tax=Chitinophaga sp. TaxID=1869181 RepID=UPI002C7EB177|nr:VOC family protein [Chitinophaga sp.]HVI45703.1 VOC family protein [Chitinophaga sp.]